MIDPLDANTLLPARKAARLSRAALADYAGVDPSTIYRIEKQGQRPRMSVWVKIVRAIEAHQRPAKRA